MDPKAKKVLDAAMKWTDNPTVANAGKLKSAVAGYREALKKERRIAGRPNYPDRSTGTPAVTEKGLPKEPTKKKPTGPPPGSTSSMFDTSEDKKD